MTEEIITRDSAAFKELRRDIVKAIRAVDILNVFFVINVCLATLF